MNGARSAGGERPGTGSADDVLTEDELAVAEARTRPSLTRVIAGAAAAAVLGAGIAAGGAFFKNPVPETSEISVELSATVPATGIHDPDEVLTADDRDRLLAQAADVRLPEVVDELRFMVFRTNDYEAIGSVERHLRADEPELIDGDVFADGVLIVGVGLSPRQSFVFAGDDVADKLGLNAGDAHLETTLDAIKPQVREDDVAGGLLAGLRQAVDADAVAQARHDLAAEERLRATGISGGVGLLLAGGSVGLIGTRRHLRGRRLARARTELDVVTREYGPLAERLDGIDKRVGSLRSPLADAPMLGQWAEVRDRFRAFGPEIDRFVELEAATHEAATHEDAGHDTTARRADRASAADGTARTIVPTSPWGKMKAARADLRRRQASDEQAFYDTRDEIAQAARAVRELARAEEHVERVERMERGDAATRVEELDDLRDNVVAAQLAAPNTAYPSVSAEGTGAYRELTEIRERTARLRGAVARRADAQGPTDAQHRADAQGPADPEGDDAFLRAYVALLGDYRTALDHLREVKPTSSKAAPPHSPALFEEGYRPGYSEVGFVPFDTMKKAYSWHSPGDSTNTGGNSGGSSSDSGFSGAGGSSHF
ncbi:hypothetical protein [Corynebacterium frankenforstense]